MAKSNIDVTFDVRFAEATKIVAEQAKDERLWFHAERITESTLQTELRRLHAAIEGVDPDDCARGVLKSIGRRHKAPVGECDLCDEMRAKDDNFHPPHDASTRCESGGHSHCSCDTCF